MSEDLRTIRKRIKEAMREAREDESPELQEFNHGQVLAYTAVLRMLEQLPDGWAQDPPKAGQWFVHLPADSSPCRGALWTPYSKPGQWLNERGHCTVADVAEWAARGDWFFIIPECKP